MLDGVYVSDLMKCLEMIPHPDSIEEDSITLRLGNKKTMQGFMRGDSPAQDVGNLYTVRLKKAWNKNRTAIVWVFSD